MAVTLRPGTPDDARGVAEVNASAWRSEAEPHPLRDHGFAFPLSGHDPQAADRCNENLKGGLVGSLRPFWPEYCYTCRGSPGVHPAREEEPWKDAACVPAN